MKIYRAILVYLVIVFSSVGCTTSKQSPTTIEGNAPVASPFSKIHIGMSQAQVHDILGPPSDTASHTTGKMFIPCYFGNDTMRFEEFYKGMGRVTFTGVGIVGVNLKVYSAIYDPGEDGYLGN